MLKVTSWFIFAFIGFLFTGWGLNQILVVPTFDDHWDWLTIGNAEILDYIKFRFQYHGLWTAADGMFIMLAALIGFRKRESWVWWALAYVPVHIILLTTQAYWLFFITIPLVLMAAGALWVIHRQLQPHTSNRRGIGWTVLFAFGLLFLYFAYDNFFVVPALDVHDPDRGWAWLTTDPDVIAYINLHFRLFGIHVFGFAMLTLLTTMCGLREGYRSAWNPLWLVPLLLLAHLLLWPTFIPILIILALLAGLGLWWAYPKKALVQTPPNTAST